MSDFVRKTKIFSLEKNSKSRRIWKQISRIRRFDPNFNLRDYSWPGVGKGPGSIFENSGIWAGTGLRCWAPGSRPSRIFSFRLNQKEHLKKPGIKIPGLRKPGLRNGRAGRPGPVPIPGINIS